MNFLKPTISFKKPSELEFEKAFAPITEEDLRKSIEQPTKYCDDGTLNENYVEYMKNKNHPAYKYLKDSPLRKGKRQ